MLRHLGEAYNEYIFYERNRPYLKIANLYTLLIYRSLMYLIKDYKIIDKIYVLFGLLCVTAHESFASSKIKPFILNYLVLFVGFRDNRC